MTDAPPLQESPERAELSPWLWLVAPLALALLPYAVHAVDPAAYESWVRTEAGVMENATALLLLVAVVSGSLALLGVSVVSSPLRLRSWILLLTLGCLYFLGEEVSWGQHYFGWTTPEGLAELNEQGETNLHNIGGWTEAFLDQGPRSLLTVAALVGGVIAPLFLRRRRGAWDPRTRLATWIWPTMVCLPASILALVSSLPAKVARAVGGEVPELLDIRGGESKECFLAFFLMLYLVSLRVRLRRLAGEDSTPNPTP
jgi:hypothetical protein